jgi:hypothetical protein
MNVLAGNPDARCEDLCRAHDGTLDCLASAPSGCDELFPRARRCVGETHGH